MDWFRDPEKNHLIPIQDLKKAPDSQYWLKAARFVSKDRNG